MNAAGDNTAAVRWEAEAGADLLLDRLSRSDSDPADLLLPLADERRRPSGGMVIGDSAGDAPANKGFGRDVVIAAGGCNGWASMGWRHGVPPIRSGAGQVGIGLLAKPSAADVEL
mmetsp:Transcript_24967/g.72045  ORF Transcript_24967/g.72045 Transcript_24967/m.72045 type:complete len:115 (+) Transcript_24967:268-612(+)